MALGEFPPITFIHLPGDLPTFDKVNGQTRVEVECSEELGRTSVISVHANHAPDEGDAITPHEERLAYGVYFQMTTSEGWDGERVLEIFDSLSVEAARELAYGLITVANEVERSA